MIPRSVIIADDDRLVRESLCEVIAGLGCEATPADGGREALRLLDARPCGLLLSDVDMPDLGGFDLLGLVRRRAAPVPTALMSARADAALAARAAAEGAITLLAKPVPVTAIAGLVRTILHL